MYSSVLNRSVKSGKSEIFISGPELSHYNQKTLHHAATVARQSSIQECQIVRIQFIDTDDLTASKDRSGIPATQYRFLHILTSSKDCRSTAKVLVRIGDSKHLCALAYTDITQAKIDGRNMLAQQ